MIVGDKGEEKAGGRRQEEERVKGKKSDTNRYTVHEYNPILNT